MSQSVRAIAGILGIVLMTVMVGTGCTPTVQVKAPKEPITINLNINLKADVRLRLQEQAQEDISENPGIF